MENIISAKNIYKFYGEYDSKFEALKDINLDIKRGEFIGIMGPSGSGKSTLINILSTLDNHTKGNLFINGQDISKINNKELSDFRMKNIGFIFQNNNLLDTLTNRDNILTPLIIAEKGRDESNRIVEELAKKLGIEELLDKYPSECSGGQRRRVAIARALSNKPNIIVADEPTDSLDVKMAMEVIETLKRLNIEDGITVILVTHDQLIGSYCDRVVLVKDGKLENEIVREYKNGEEQIEFYRKVVNLTSKNIEDLLGVI